MCGLMLALSTGQLAAQQRVAVVGRLLDAETSNPIEGAVVEVVELALGSVTDGSGRFTIMGVGPGVYELRVRHLSYGVRSETIDVIGGADRAFDLRLSARALELEPIDVEVLAETTVGGSRSNVITRLQIERVAGRARHIGDVVRAYIPSATVSEGRGGSLCLEFRAARSSRITGCNYPLIVVDGLPVESAARYLRDLPVEDLERIEFVTASEGAARYGMGATHGVLVIETRRSGVVRDRATPSRVGPTYPSYAWDNEPARHPSARAFAAAALGSLGGVAMGLAAVGCFPGSEGAGGACIQGAGVGSGLSALALPLVGSALGARLFGVTNDSRGKIFPSLALSMLPASLGYAIYVEGVKAGFAGERVLGAVLVTVGTPLVATLADHLFRSHR